MRRLAIAILVLCATCGVIAYWRIQTTPPYYDRVHYQYWRYGAEMTVLAEAIIDRRTDFDWIALADGSVQAGSEFEYRVELDDQTRQSFRELMEAADLYFIHAFHPDDGEGAHVDLGGGRRWNRDFSVYYRYQRNGQFPAAECAGQYRDSNYGGCSMMLGKNWAYDVAWIAEGHVFPGEESDTNFERRITVP